MGVSDLRVRLRVAWHALRGHGVAYRVRIDGRLGAPLFSVAEPGIVHDVTIEYLHMSVVVVPDELVS